MQKILFFNEIQFFEMGIDGLFAYCWPIEAMLC